MSKRLEAVVEIEDWSLPRDEQFIRLWKNTTRKDTERVISHIVNYGEETIETNIEKIIEKFINAELLIVSGGVKVVEEAKEIYPGCCCGLEDWDDWLTLSPEKTDVWFGHDPSPHIEFLPENQIYRVQDHGGMIKNADGKWVENSEKGIHIDFTDEELRQALDDVSQDLTDFLFVLKDWIERIDENRAEDLIEKFKKDFNINWFVNV